MIIVGQTATMSFTVLYLSESRSFSTGAAALVLAASQAFGGILRILAGHWSDRRGTRTVPLCRLALAVSVTLAIVAALTHAPRSILVPALVAAGAIGLSWNGLSFVAAAEVAGAKASGAAIGLQQTLLGIASIVTPIGFAALVSSASWRVAFLSAGLFPLLGWALIHPLAVESRRLSRLRAPR
jgi:MFS family permease